MRHLYLLVVLMLICSAADCQLKSASPRFTALGGSGVALQDVSSLLANQAGLTDLKSPAIAVFHETIPAGVSRNSAIVAMPSRKNVVGVGFQSYGVDQYVEQRVAVAAARRFGSFSLSLNLNIHHLNISGYGTANAWSVESGFQYKLAPSVTFGLHVSNPSRNSYNVNCNAFVPSNIESGVAWQLSDKVLLNAVLSKDLDFDLSLSTGLEYNLSDRFFLRGAFSTEPFSEHAGIGTSFGSFSFECAVSVEARFGYSPKLGLRYDF